jgi:hypothetical protein
MISLGKEISGQASLPWYMPVKDEAPAVLGTQQAEEFIVSLLRANGPLSTMEVEQLARKENKRCPDQTVLFLTKMRKKGLIKGEPSIERRGWVWSAP